ncbi:acetylglutamate kinase [Litorilituus lipolyticus]|uniref:Acetylglutamate kinase n=1 Tax=Litorilituus lipolyticus TaxID=2491017 RepID=A0A502L191_9GAMM|nr:acetylglutamate kinase [Litorilituus lipolyticus]TPH17648.1 acetylglutamate kinase [Litorilituus lipolyticus]
MTDNQSHQPIAVVKVGGDVLQGEVERSGIAANVKDLVDAGWRVVLLHGGGPQVNELQEKHGLVPNKVAGRRITSEADLLVVKQAICGEVNVSLAQELQQVGVNAFACNGASGKLVTATKRPPRVMSGAGDKPIDFGEVGDVASVNAALLTQLTELGLVPVIATLGVEEDSGRIFNINADTTVVQIARALKADLLLLTTAVGAIYGELGDEDTRIAHVNEQEARELINEGVIQGGMIPKVEEALSVLVDGVKNIAIVGPQIKGAFLDVAVGKGDKGTRISL